jgi:hypothetical protein
MEYSSIRFFFNSTLLQACAMRRDSGVEVSGILDLEVVFPDFRSIKVEKMDWRE